MGEEKEKIKAKGVEKKNNDAGEKPSGGGKNDDGVATILLNLDLHCEGCAKKVKRSVRHFEGVEDVKADYSTGKLTVKGNVDPLWLRDMVEIKTKKKVALLSAQPKFDAGGGQNKSDEKDEKKAEENKAEDKKLKKTQFKREVIRVHCDGSAQKVKRFIIKELLTPYLKDKLKRNVGVPPKKHGGSGGRGDNKKEKDVGGGGDGDGSKKKYVESTVAQSKSTEPKEKKTQVINKMEYYYGCTMPPMYNQNYSNQDYGVTMHDHGYYVPPPPPSYFTTPRNHGYYGRTGYVSPRHLATTRDHSHGYGHDTGYVSPRHLATARDHSHGYGHDTGYVSPRHLATTRDHGHGYGHVSPRHLATTRDHSHGYGHDSGYVPPPYTTPQLFSDENPNGCSVM